MKKYEYLDRRGTFQLESPDRFSYLYFPIANEAGVLGSVTPTWGGDSKLGQNAFLLEPVSAENQAREPLWRLPGFLTWESCRHHRSRWRDSGRIAAAHSGPASTARPDRLDRT